MRMGELDLSAVVADWPVGDASVGVVGRDGELARHDSGATFRWASVTKLLTALTVLDACSDGVISLDDPLGPPGATVAHLLAHASGLPWDGEVPLSRVGVKRTYAARVGYELLAVHLTESSSVPFGTELRRRVLHPLGMDRTTVGSPASGAESPLSDLQRLATELLIPTELDPAIVTQASTVAFPGLAGVLPGFGRQASNDWGLGCEIRDSKSPHWTSPENSPATFGHFGMSGSFLWVDPVAGLACVSLSDTDFGDWSKAKWPELSTQVLHAYT